MCETGAGKKEAAGRQEYEAMGEHLFLPQSEFMLV